MLEIIFNGELDPNNPNLVHYTGTVDPYGTITITYNRLTGAWSADIPANFPSGLDITAVWQDLDPEVIRPEPSSLTNQDSLGTAESAIVGLPGTIGGTLNSLGVRIGGTVSGTIEAEFLDDVPFRRPLIGEGERRLTECLQLTGQAKASVVLRRPTVLDQSNVPWVVQSVPSQTGIYPAQIAFAESQTYHDTCFALSPNGYSYAGLVYGVLVADPQAFFSPAFRTNLWEWWPFNEHPEADLQVEEKLWKGTAPLRRPLIAVDRTLVDGWGWMLHLGRGSSISLPLHQSFPGTGEPFSLSFRFKPLILGKDDTTTALLRLGNLRLNLNSLGSIVFTLTTNGEDGPAVAQSGFVYGTEYYVLLTYDGTKITNLRMYAAGDADGAPTWSYGPSATFDVGDETEITIGAESSTTMFGDLRIWNAEKSLTDLIALRHRTFRVAAQARWPSTVVSPNGDVLAMMTWPNSSFVYLGMNKLDSLPTYLLEREDAELLMEEAKVTGDPRMEDLGLDGGQTPTQPWTLGQQFHPVLADGTVVVSTTHGVIGRNAPWEDEWVLGQEPNRNVGFHRVFTTSADGKTWMIQVKGTVGAPVIDISEVERGGAEMPLIDGGNYSLSVVNGTLTRLGPSALFPTLYLYGQSDVCVDVNGTGSWADPTDFGQTLGIPAIDHRGKLTFYIATSLNPGPYRLTLDAGNIGQVEDDFEGLHVEVSVGQVVTFPMIVTGAELLNPRSLITKDFELTETVPAGWLLEISWEGKLNSPQQHLSYALAVYGATLEQMLPTLYRVDSPTILTPVSPSTHVKAATIPGTTPGGWIAVIGTTGSICDWTHESEEMTRNLPLGHVASVISETVTGSTLKRQEDILLSSPDWALDDPAAPAMPVISTFSTPHTANMGDTIVYTASGVANASALIWEFWDGEVRVTAPTVTTQSKLLTSGWVITSKLTAVDAVGRSVSLTDTFTANWAPRVLGLSISANDEVAPYNTIVTVAVDDIDSNSGTYPSTKIYGTINGTVATVNTTIGGTIAGTLTIPLRIAGDVDYVLTLSDDPGADRSVPIAFRAKETRPIFVAVTPIPRYLRLGAGSTLKLTAVASDPDGDAISSFSWEFVHSDGTSTNYPNSGTTQPLNGGAWQNTLVLDVSAEAQGSAMCIVTVTTATGKTGTGQASVTFDVNDPPILRTFTCVPGIVTPGKTFEFGADAYDPEMDAISYSWTFTDPAGIALSGNPVLVTPATAVIKGTLTMTDVLGASVVEVIPPVLVTSPMVVTGTVGKQFLYVPTAMGDPAPTFSVDQVPPGMAYVNGTIAGVPALIGLGTIGLTATNVNGVDTRHVYVSIVTGGEPLAPTNLLVKGMTYPTYHHGEDISMVWTNNEANYTVLRFYKLDNTLVLTVTMDPGVESYAIDNAHLVQALGSEQPFIVHAHSSNGTVESGTFVEAGVDFLG